MCAGCPDLYISRMGGKCCCDRKEPHASALRSNTGTQRGGAARRSGRFNQLKAPPPTGEPDEREPISFAFHAKGDDAAKFDRAFAHKDYKACVELLASDQPIESVEDRMHPWAEDPKTIGALTATQLAILASTGARDTPRVKDQIREAGAIPELVKFLESPERDRVQIAVVALSFLSVDNPLNVDAAYEAGAMPLLTQHLDSKVFGMRVAAAAVLHNMCLKDEYREQFIQLGGIAGFVNQLSAVPDLAPNHTDMQLEAIMNLTDLLETQDGDIINDYAMAAIHAGAEEKLEILAEAVSEDVRQESIELLRHLQKAKILSTR